MRNGLVNVKSERAVGENLDAQGKMVCDRAENAECNASPKLGRGLAATCCYIA